MGESGNVLPERERGRRNPSHGLLHCGTAKVVPQEKSSEVQ